MTDLPLRAAIAAGVAVLLITEIASAFGAVARGPLLTAWLIAIAIGAWVLARSGAQPRRFRVSLLPALLGFACAAIAIAAFVTAWFSAPNTYDAMTYHLPRVVYWAQARSVAPFPSHYIPLVTFPPLAEYIMLHTYVLSGGDAFVNLISWAAFALSIMGVAAVARELGAGAVGQAMAALLCATSPGAILQASGAKNDLVLALWLVSLAYFALRGEAWWAGAAFALALATKGTAYFFAPPVLAFCTKNRRARIVCIAAVAALALNAPHYARNLAVSGSPLGFDSAFADGSFRWRNDRPGVRTVLSNALRHLSEQLGTASQTWNGQVYAAVVYAHALIGADAQDPTSTWQWSRYNPPVDTRHEANANNRFHLLFLAFAAAAAVVLREQRVVRLLAAAFAAFALYCLLLRWQPYGARLLVPLFVGAMPAAGRMLERVRPRAVAVLICVFLLDRARLPAIENWTRPLRGAESVLQTPRESQYFRDSGGGGDEKAYRAAAETIARAGCREVGIDATQNQLEYAFQALLLEREPRARFRHVGVRNATAPYPLGEEAAVCAVFCLHCAGREEKAAAYGATGEAVVLGRSVLFVARPAARRHGGPVRLRPYVRVVSPVRYRSTARAALRPSEIAQTTSDCPRRRSPAANTPATEVM